MPACDEVLQTAIQLVGTLAAAFLGAWFAFKFQRNQAADEARREHMATANWALSQLASQHRQFTLLKAHIDAQDIPTDVLPYRLRGLSVADNLDRLHLEQGRLAFLLDQSPQLFIRLSDAQRDINTAVGTVLQRSQFHKDVIQPAVERVRNALGTDHVPENLPELMARELGFMFDTQIRAQTTQTLGGIEHAIEVAMGAFNDLSEAVSKIYPSESQVSLQTT